MKYGFYNGYVLDGSKEMEPLRDRLILVSGNKIEKVLSLIPAAVSSPTAIQKAYPGYHLIDLQGKYLLPGLINLHVHLPASGRPKKKSGNPAGLVKFLLSTPLTRFLIEKVCEANVKTALMSGVTTLRTVGGIEHYDSLIRDKIRDGYVLGPRMLVSDYALSVEGGHMTGSVAKAAHSVEEIVAMVEENASHQPDLIKLMITGGVLDAKVPGEPGEMRMDPSYIEAACQRAHELGLYTAAHVESPEGVKQALLHGVDTIEHGAAPTEEIIQLFKERNAALVTTLSPAVPYAVLDPKISYASSLGQINGKVVFEGIKEMAIRCLKEGIPVGLGTDVGCPFVTHYDMWRELIYFVKYCGVTPKMALYTATLGNAKIGRVDAITGSIEEGKEADLIVVDKNPLEDLYTLRNVHMVITRGRLIPNPKIKRNKKIDHALDPLMIN